MFRARVRVKARVRVRVRVSIRVRVRVRVRALVVRESCQGNISKATGLCLLEGMFGCCN